MRALEAGGTDIQLPGLVVNIEGSPVDIGVPDSPRVSLGVTHVVAGVGLFAANVALRHCFTFDRSKLRRYNPQETIPESERADKCPRDRPSPFRPGRSRR